MRAILVVATLLLSTPGAAQQSIASRVAAVHDGVVRMEYLARPGVCGNGRDVIAFGHAFFSRSIESWGGRWSNNECKPGPVRVALTIAGGEPVQVNTQIGGSWRPTDERVVDLGVVSSREAANFLIGYAPKLEGFSSKDRVLLPAALAADAEVLEPLRSIARNSARTVHLRRQAVQWMGLIGNGSVIPDLVQFARSNDAGEKKSFSGAALGALAELREEGGVPALLELSRDGNSELRRETAFWLGQVEDPRALKRLRQIIDDRTEETRVRSHAIFAISQAESVPAKDLVAIYNEMTEPSLREQAIFALSQRNEESAVDALLAIAKNDSDKHMRGKALFWLAQKHDPRVTKLISDILVK